MTTDWGNTWWWRETPQSGSGRPWRDATGEWGPMRESSQLVQWWNFDSMCLLPVVGRLHASFIRANNGTMTIPDKSVITWAIMSATTSRCHM